MSKNNIRTSAEKPVNFTRFLNISSTLPTALALLAGCAMASGPENTPQPGPEAIEHGQGATLSTVVSVDGLGMLDPDGGPQLGDGSGDLVLLAYDPSGRSPRKRSILLDLSYTESNGSINDLTVNDIRNAKKSFATSHPELDAFISSSKNPKEILWQVFGIANHTTPNVDISKLKLDFHGLITTESRLPKNAMRSNDIHRSKAYRADLIMQNIEYDIETNGAMIAFTGEPPAYNPELHATLTNGIETKGNLNQSLFLGAHLSTLIPAAGDKPATFGTTYENYGKIKLTYNEREQKALLEFKPR